MRNSIVNKGKRNFGYGRRLDYAGKMALRERFGGGHYGSQASHGDRWGRFSSWARSQGVKDMRQITAEHVRQFADSVRSLSVANRQNLVSTINVVMRHASGGRWDRLSPRQVVGESRSNVRTTPPPSLQQHQDAVNQMRAAGLDRAAAVADLARYLGMRSEEAVKADLNRLWREAEQRGAVNVQEGTKGGRNVDRWVPLSDVGRAALKAAQAASPAGSRNLLASDESYRQAREGWIRAGRERYAAGTGGRGYHDARSAYACDRYRALTGHPAPVVGGSMQATRSADLEARSVIAGELGHGRVDVAASYIGGRRTKRGR